MGGDPAWDAHSHILSLAGTSVAFHPGDNTPLPRVAAKLEKHLPKILSTLNGDSVAMQVLAVLSAVRQLHGAR